MPIERARGDLLTAKVDALVNPVNTVGVMGKGLARQFKLAHPDMFEAYVSACHSGELVVGRVHVFAIAQPRPDHPRFILNLPTKRHWRGKSKLEFVRDGLAALVDAVETHAIDSLAMPALGCGHGGLDWDEVRPLIVAALEPLSQVRVQLYAPR